MGRILLLICYLKALFALSKFWGFFFWKKFCHQEAISCTNYIFHRPKLSQVFPNFKDAFENVWKLHRKFREDNQLFIVPLIDVFG